MRVDVCTLFEKEYHLGVAVLVNSLARAGFRGDVHIGFRGALPPWATGRVTQQDETTWHMPVPDGPRLVFSLIETDAHFTNFKPDFMLQVLGKSDADTVLYFDPDVVVNTTWKYLEEWLSCGVALCDDVNSPVAENHPRRVGWRRFFQGSSHDLRFRGIQYANGGVVGVPRVHQRFLEVWMELLTAASASLGGADVAGISGGRTLKDAYGFADCFRQPDQDTLNAAIEACPDIPVSFLGKQAMGFDAGAPMLPHATGPRKPWTRHFIREALAGRAPARVDKCFWRFADGPLQPFSSGHLAVARWRVRLAAGLGRLIRRT
jgi:hypothetical protein